MIRAIPALIEAFKSQYSLVGFRAANALVSFGTQSVMPLIAVFHTPIHKEVRSGIISALEEIGGAEATSEIIACLQDDDLEVSLQAISALGNIDDSRTVTSLLPLLAHNKKEIRQVAAEALGRQKDSRAIYPLQALKQNDPDPDVRKAAEAALSKL